MVVIQRIAADCISTDREGKVILWAVVIFSDRFGNTRSKEVTASRRPGAASVFSFRRSDWGAQGSKVWYYIVAVEKTITGITVLKNKESGKRMKELDLCKPAVGG